jgi:copper(I)-binding protein
MVSRQTTRPLRKLVPAVAIGVSALLGVVGCGAGQVSQTAEMEPAVNGNTAQVGTIALRNVMVAFPESGEAYQEGDDAPLLLSIVNTGADDDELVGVTSPAGEVEIIGNPAVPEGNAVIVVLPGDNPSAPSSAPTTTTTTGAGASSESSATNETPGAGASEPAGSSSSAPSSGVISSGPGSTDDNAEPEAVDPPVVGTLSLVVKNLKAALPFGKNVPVTFEFAKAGKVTVQLPVGAPATARPEPEAVEEEH